MIEISKTRIAMLQNFKKKTNLRKENSYTRFRSLHNRGFRYAMMNLHSIQKVQFPSASKIKN